MATQAVIRSWASAFNPKARRDAVSCFSGVKPTVVNFEAIGSIRFTLILLFPLKAVCDRYSS